MTLHPPFMITARLMPGLQVGDAYLSLEKVDKGKIENCLGARFRPFFILDFPKGKEFKFHDMQTGCSQRYSMESLFTDFLGYLDDATEDYSQAGQIWHDIHLDATARVFPQRVVKWAFRFRCEIMDLVETINKAGKLIEP